MAKDIDDEYGELHAVAETIERVERVPGLLRCWDVEQLLDQGSVFVIEPGGKLDDGTEVYQVLRCARRIEAENQPSAQARSETN